MPIAIAACAGVVAYALAQIIQSTWFPAPDPRRTPSGGRIAFFWRAWMSLYVAVLIGIGAAGFRARVGAGLDRMLPPLIVGVALTALVQGIWFP